jgi:hypothetical protein
MNLRNSLIRLHNGEITLMPPNAFRGIDLLELASLVQYAVRVLNHMNDKKIMTLNCNDLSSMGFNSLIRGTKPVPEIRHTCDLLKLAFPHIRNFELTHKEKGFFNSKENVFEMIAYYSNDSREPSKLMLNEKIHTDTVKLHFADRDSMIVEYNTWLTNRFCIRSRCLDNLLKYEEILKDPHGILFQGFWDTMSDVEFSHLIRHIILVKFQLVYGDDLFSSLDKLDFTKYKVEIFNNLPFTTYSGVTLKTRQDLIYFVYTTR